jgi:hypothetical protein
MHAGSLLDGLIVHVVDDLGASQENLSSLHRLATATDPDTDDVRLTLAQHVESSEAPVHREQKPAAAERLKAHQRLRLVMDGTPLPPDPYAATHPHDT